MMSQNQPAQRYKILFLGAIAIFFTGFPHIWSIYQPYAMDLTGWTQNQAAMCFYISFVFFVVGNIAGGKLQDSFSPRIAVLLGGALFAAGILLSAFALKSSPFLMYLTYGVMQGIGQGMMYTTIISVAQKWFTGRTGFASGVIVTANGLFGFIMAPVSRTILEKNGIKAAFLLIGILIAAAWLAAVLVIKNPPEQDQTSILYEGRQYTAAEMFRTKKFYYMLSTMLFGLIPYFLLSPISQVIQMEQGVSASVAVGAVMAGSVFNALTRLILPSAADKLGRIICLKGVLFLAIIAMGLLAALPSVMSTICVVLVYACYGGIMGSFPSLCSSIFGLRYSGENYGYVMFGMAAATLGTPAISSAVSNAGYGVSMSFMIGAVCAGVALIFLFLLEHESKA